MSTETSQSSAKAPSSDSSPQAEWLLKLSTQLAGAADIEAIVRLVVDSLDELWSWDAAFVAIRKMGRLWYDTILQFDTVDGERRPVKPRRFEAAEYQALGNLMKGEPLLINRGGEQAAPHLRRFGDVQRPSSSLMYASIGKEGQPLGIISVQSYSPAHFGAEDLLLLQQVADLLSPAVARGLVERTNAVLGSLGVRLSSAITSAEVGQVILDTAQELLGWDACLVDLYRKHDDRVDVVLNIDTVAGGRVKLPPPPEPLQPSGVMRRVMSHGAQIILRSHPAQEAGELQAYGDTERRSASILYVPIRTAAEPIGVLSIQSYIAQAYDEHDLATLQVLADHCAGALERTRAQNALQESQQRFQSVIESLGEGLFLTDTKDVIQYVNSRFLEISGYTAEDLVGRNAGELLVSDADREAMKKRLDERLNGDSSRYAVELRRRDGATFWVEVCGTALRDAVGNIIGTVGAMTDITARRRTEQQDSILAELAGKLAAARSLLEIAEGIEIAFLALWNPDSYFVSVKTPEGRYQAILATDTVEGERVHWPNGGENLAQLAEDHPVRRGEPTLINREDESESQLPRYGDLARPGMSLVFAGMKSGEDLIGVLSIQSYTRSMFHDSDLQLLQRLAHIVGPTVGRCLAEEALRRSEAELRSIVSAMTDIIIVYDSDCRYVKVAQTQSPRLQKLTEPLVGKTVYDVMPVNIAQRINEYVRTCLATRRPLVLEYKAGKGSNEAWFSASIGPLTENTVVFVAHDITERMRTAKTRGVLAELGEELSGCLSPQQAAAAVLSAADNLFTWDAAFLDAQEPDGGFTTLIGFDVIDGVRQEIYSTHDGTPSENTRRTLANGAQLILRHPDNSHEPLVGFGESNRPSASLMFVPIRRGTRSFGILSVQSYTADLYSDEDLRLLQLLADYCSSALHRTSIESDLRDSEERLRLLVSQMPVLMWSTDRDLRLVAGMGTSFERLGIKLNSTSGTLLHDYFGLATDEELPIEMHQRALAGHNASFEMKWHGRHVNAFVEPLKNSVGEIIGTVGVAHDVTERKQIEMQLHHGAFHDALTDLPNRALFMDWLSRALAHSQRRPSYKFAVLFLDLDRFKNINDSLGHNFGDKLLVHVAERLRECLRTDDMVARIGGDEFAVFVDDIDDISRAVAVSEKIMHELSLPFTIDSHVVFTGTSIGIAVSSTGYERPDDLLRDADAAMYRAKAAGKGRYEIFDAKMHAHVMSLLKLESDMRRAIVAEEFVVYYQPIVSLRSGTVAGFEALLRWEHPERGVVCPAEFVPLAEETGLIVPIGIWVLRTACAQLSLWHKHGTVARTATMSVNVSARQFQENLLAGVEEVLQQTGLSGSALKLEITESTIMNNADISNRMLQDLRALDVQLQVDDFGTGYSSLAYLNQFPIDALKIDKSFIANLGVKEESLEIIRTIVTMAQTLGMESVAEGIETGEQLLQLKALGCKYGQGYYFSPPLDADKAETMLHERWRT